MIRKKLYKLPKTGVTPSDVLPEKSIVVYIHLDRSTSSERLHLPPATNQLNAIRYKRGVPHQHHYLYLGEAYSLTGQRICVFEEARHEG